MNCKKNCPLKASRHNDDYTLGYCDGMEEGYNQALEDLQKMIDYEYYDGGYGDYHEVEMIVRMIERLKK